MSYKFTKIIYSTSVNPFENLAIENHLLLSLNKGESILLVYANNPSIVMGRFQNPWIECNISKLKSNNVELVRRQSGGGSVYHDSGNLNFCFLHGNRDYFKDTNNEFLVKFLSDFKIPAIVNERSDIVLDIEGKIYKFSGSAFKQKKDRSFHHCTMLVDSDLKLLKSILDSPLKGLKTKSTPSKPVPVKNLIEINSKVNLKVLVEHLKHFTDDFREICYSGEEESYLEKLISWDWVYGETPLFECTLSINDSEILLEIKKGIILSAASEDSDLGSLCLKLVDMNLKSFLDNSYKLKEEAYGDQAIEALLRLDLMSDATPTTP